MGKLYEEVCEYDGLFDASEFTSSLLYPKYRTSSVYDLEVI